MIWLIEGYSNMISNSAEVTIGLSQYPRLRPLSTEVQVHAPPGSRTNQQLSTDMKKLKFILLLFTSKYYKVMEEPPKFVTT